MAHHSLRTLIRRGDPAAMDFLGFPPDPDVEARVRVDSPKVRPGEALEFTVSINSASDVRLRVDYIIDFVRKSGDTSPRTYKLKQVSMESGEERLWRKRHPLRANASTYTLYPGTHRLTIVANGKPLASGAFELVDGAEIRP